MPRSISIECPKTPAIRHSGTITKTYTIKVITPMVGGGAVAGKADEDLLIRPSAIRGHLRFWWRATRGAECENVGELKQREGAIWGTAEEPSKVEVRVTQPTGISYRRPNDPGRYGFSQSGPEAYILFATKSEIIKEGFSFILEIILPKNLENDVIASLWAWINFGGIGARTRRGCGALWCRDFSPIENGSSCIKNWYQTQLKNFGIHLSPTIKQWPTLPPHDDILIEESLQDHLTTWRQAISLLKKFRQNGVGRNGRGRSFWPEPESIREVTSGGRERSRNLHPRDENIPVKFFPRSELGMPIVFEIRNEHLKPTLQPNEKNKRLSSPIILKPLSISERQSFSLFFKLNTKKLESAYLVGGGIQTPYTIDSEHISNQLLSNYQNSPMGINNNNQIRSPQGSALEAFINFAKENGFK